MLYFDKGIGICIMSSETYQDKLRDIINLPQFEKVVSTRKNAKHPVFKEEEKVVTFLKKLLDKKKINEELHDKLKPRGSQAPQLSKIYKDEVPLQPVLSMPGSANQSRAKLTG